LISDEGQQIEEINEEVEHKMKEDLEKSDEARKKETPETNTTLKAVKKDSHSHNDMKKDRRAYPAILSFLI
jgi:hypothetical protein